MKGLFRFFKDLNKILAAVDKKSPKRNKKEKGLHAETLAETLVDNMISHWSDAYTKMRDDYFNPENYTKSRQVTYQLWDKLKSLHDSDLQTFEQKVIENFNTLKEKYSDGIFVLKEKAKLYAPNDIQWEFFRDFFHIFKQIAHRYKKIKNQQKYEDIFIFLYKEAGSSGLWIKTLLNMTDFRKIAKIARNRWDISTAEQCEKYDRLKAEERARQEKEAEKWARKQLLKKLDDLSQSYSMVKIKSASWGDCCKKYDGMSIDFSEARKLASKNKMPDCDCPIYFIGDRKHKNV